MSILESSAFPPPMRWEDQAVIDDAELAAAAFLARYSGGLVAPADTNTGLNFVTRANVARYLGTRSRYEGSSRADAYPVQPR